MKHKVFLDKMEHFSVIVSAENKKAAEDKARALFIRKERMDLEDYLYNYTSEEKIVAKPFIEEKPSDTFFFKHDYKLCYISENIAYFTTLPLSEQWGDDWNDAPYEHNAGPPYEPCWHNAPGNLHDPYRGHVKAGELCQCESCAKGWTKTGKPKWSILRVSYGGPFETPSTGRSNGPYSVADINKGKVPWLTAQGGTRGIFAGASLEEFKKYIEYFGGYVN